LSRSWLARSKTRCQRRARLGAHARPATGQGLHRPAIFVDQEQRARSRGASSCKDNRPSRPVCRRTPPGPAATTFCHPSGVGAHAPANSHSAGAFYFHVGTQLACTRAGTLTRRVLEPLAVVAPGRSGASLWPRRTSTARRQAASWSRSPVASSRSRKRHCAHGAEAAAPRSKQPDVPPAPVLVQLRYLTGRWPPSGS